MALFRSDRVTQASGSIGGTTFSHNRFGLYFRARRTPVNRNTVFQQSQREALAAASAGWRDLSSSQRAAWEVYAAATPVTNKLGETVFLSGAGQYSATNSFALRVGLTTFAAAPTTPGRQALGSPTIVIDASAATVTVTALEDPATDDVTLALFVGDPQSAGRSFFAGPYQQRGVASVATGTASYTTQTGRNSLAYVAGQRIPVRLHGITTDGRLTTVASTIVTVQA